MTAGSEEHLNILRGSIEDRRKLRGCHLCGGWWLCGCGNFERKTLKLKIFACARISSDNRTLIAFGASVARLKLI